MLCENRSENGCGKHQQEDHVEQPGFISISGFVLLEKISSGNQVVSRLGGLLFIGWAAWIAALQELVVGATERQRVAC